MEKSDACFLVIGLSVANLAKLLLKLLIGIIDTKLLETVNFEGFKTVTFTFIECFLLV